MSFQTMPQGERLHIVFFGKCNTGKSSLVNAITGQKMSLVSQVRGTTTDPVRKTMELLPLGPVVIIDTPGFDDESELGRMRIQKTQEMLAKTDIAVLVADAEAGLDAADRRLLAVLKERNIVHIIAYNKYDLVTAAMPAGKNEVFVSAKTGLNISTLKEMLGAVAKNRKQSKPIVADILKPNQLVILVIPLDEAAPKGRLILPQQMVMRELLDSGCMVTACRDSELTRMLSALAEKPALVITDSQVFKTAAAVIPESIPLTSFSILMARYKGMLNTLVEGAEQLKALQDGDKVLISEGCTHHRQCNDIGTVKLPQWITAYSGAQPAYTFTSGGDFPQDLSPYRLVIHCGGCMLNESEMKNRIQRAVTARVPIVNYGIAIAQMHGILQRALQPFCDTCC
ncbi:MAG: [FeFe] hydrogenase H-cluster maturation GTPase HydF [Treponema sp.]